MLSPKESAPAPLPTGYILQSRTRQFRISGVLGRGGYGITYRAINMLPFTTDWGMHIPKDAELAIKECYMEKGVMQRQPNGLARLLHRERGMKLRSMFLREARELMENQKRYQHNKNTVEGAVPLLHVAFQGEGNPNIRDYSGDAVYYLVMPYLAGGSLSSHAGEDNLRMVHQWLCRLLSTLSRLHRESMLHRDIKPANIMLHKGEPILIDFGIATSFGESATASGYTPDYAAPEQMTGASGTTALSDLYSLGATMYYVLTGGKPPSAQLRQRGTLYRSLLSNENLRKKMTKAGDKMLMTRMLESVDKALMMNPRDRWDSADAWLQYISAPAKAQDSEGSLTGLKNWVDKQDSFELIVKLLIVFIVIVTILILMVV